MIEIRDVSARDDKPFLQENEGLDFKAYVLCSLRARIQILLYKFEQVKRTTWNISLLYWKYFSAEKNQQAKRIAHLGKATNIFSLFFSRLHRVYVNV